MDFAGNQVFDLTLLQNMLWSFKHFMKNESRSFSQKQLTLIGMSYESKKNAHL